MKKKVLITGSHGLIGSLLTKRLSNTRDIYGVDMGGDDTAHYVSADIADATLLEEKLQAFDPLECIVHLAANAHVDAPWESLFATNITGTRNIYEYARTHRVQRIVFASTNRVTGGYEGTPKNLHLDPHPKLIHPSDPISPDSEYAVSKVCGEAFARYYATVHNIASLCLRLGSVLEDNDPRGDARRMRTWLSYNDLVQLIEKSTHADVTFGIYYGVSRNDGRFWDIENAQNDLDYTPQDNAATL